MCDIDHFKLVNDVHGHAVGDDVLQQFSKRIQKSIRSASDWIARYGGEEFMVMLPDTGYAGGLYVAEKLREAIGGVVFVTEGGPINITSSFGVASTRDTGPDLDTGVETLIAVADAALYRSKEGGRNRVTATEIGPLSKPESVPDPETANLGAQI
jgi:diguanylate cyclase (GGDEF)-like protein